MRRVLPWIALLSLCACATRGVELVRYRGAYSTHFEGIPDEAKVCALVTNTSGATLEWIELRLNAKSDVLAEEPSQFVSSWIWQGELAPGSAVAIELVDPPVSDSISLRVRRAGASGPAPRRGRYARSAKECSETSVRASLETSLAERTAPDLLVHEAARLLRGADESRDLGR